MARTLPSSARLTGRRGWSTVAGLTVVLSGLVAVQLPVANADVPLLAPATRSAALPAPPAGPVPVRAAAEDPSITTPLRAAAGRERAADALAAAARATSAARPATASAPRRTGSTTTAAATARTAPAPVRRAVRPATSAPAAPGLCSGAGWQARRGGAALASLKGGAPRTGFRVTFAPARPGFLGLTHLDERRIEVFVRACGTQSDELLRHVMAHELGHAWDTTRMTAASRAAYLVARGIPVTTPWYGCSRCTDFATPAGDFAETYAQWARGASTNRSELAGDASPAQLAALATRFFGA